jgi:hypothetical protein
MSLQHNDNDTVKSATPLVSGSISTSTSNTRDFLNKRTLDITQSIPDLSFTSDPYYSPDFAPHLNFLNSLDLKSYYINLSPSQLKFYYNFCFQYPIRFKSYSFFFEHMTSQLVNPTAYMTRSCVLYFNILKTYDHKRFCTIPMSSFDVDAYNYFISSVPLSYFVHCEPRYLDYELQWLTPEQYIIFCHATYRVQSVDYFSCIPKSSTSTRCYLTPTEASYFLQYSYTDNPSLSSLSSILSTFSSLNIHPSAYMTSNNILFTHIPCSSRHISNPVSNFNLLEQDVINYNAFLVLHSSYLPSHFIKYISFTSDSFVAEPDPVVSQETSPSVLAKNDLLYLSLYILSLLLLVYFRDYPIFITIYLALFLYLSHLYSNLLMFIICISSLPLCFCKFPNRLSSFFYLDYVFNFMYFIYFILGSYYSYSLSLNYRTQAFPSGDERTLRSLPKRVISRLAVQPPRVQSTDYPLPHESYDSCDVGTRWGDLLDSQFPKPMLTPYRRQLADPNKSPYGDLVELVSNRKRGLYLRSCLRPLREEDSNENSFLNLVVGDRVCDRGCSFRVQSADVIVFSSEHLLDALAVNGISLCSGNHTPLNLDDRFLSRVHYVNPPSFDPNLMLDVSHDWQTYFLQVLAIDLDDNVVCQSYGFEYGNYIYFPSNLVRHPERLTSIRIGSSTFDSFQLSHRFDLARIPVRATNRDGGCLFVLCTESKLPFSIAHPSSGFCVTSIVDSTLVYTKVSVNFANVLYRDIGLVRSLCYVQTLYLCEEVVPGQVVSLCYVSGCKFQLIGMLVFQTSSYLYFLPLSSHIATTFSGNTRSFQPQFLEYVPPYSLGNSLPLASYSSSLVAPSEPVTLLVRNGGPIQ